MPLALRAEDQVWDSSRLPGPEWAGEMLDAFPPIRRSWRVPPRWPLFFSPPPSYAPRPHGQRGPWKAGDQTWKPNRLPRAKWAGEMPTRPPLILRSWGFPRHHLSPLSRSSLPPTPLGPARPEGALENRGPGPGAQQASRGLSGWGKRLPHLP